MTDFKPVQIQLDSLSPAIVVDVLPSGFTIDRLYINPDGATHDVVIGPWTPDGHKHPAHKYQNTIVTRYSNRIPVGTHNIEKNGIKSTFEATANESPKVSLHGGPNAGDTQTFTRIDASKAKLFSKAEQKLIAASNSAEVFTLTSPAGENGYPGKLLIETLIVLVNGPPQPPPSGVPVRAALGSLIIVYRAKVEGEDGKPVVTPVNLTQHWGFNLEATGTERGAPVPSVKDHSLIIRANDILELDSDCLATGNLIPVAGTAHEHDGKRIGEGFPEKGYDDFYLFPAPTTPSTQPTRVPLTSLTSTNLLEDILQVKREGIPQAELWSQKTGIRLAFSSNQRGVQFYSANLQSGGGTRKKIHGGEGKDGDGYQPGSAAFLEFHEPIGAFLHPQLGVDTLLTSDELYHNFVRVDITFDPPQ